MKRFFIYLFCIFMLSGCTNNKNPDTEINPSPPIMEDSSIKILSQMTLDEKIGQLFIFGFDGYTPSNHILNCIEKDFIGGIIFFKRNIKTSSQTKESILHLNNHNKSNLPLFVSIDEEGGTVSRIPNLKTKSHRTLGLLNDLNETLTTANTIGATLYSLGFNMDYAPVLDVVLSKNNTLLYNRSFGSNVHIVSKHATTFNLALENNKIIGVGKHFPGHGNTTTDSHTALPSIDYTKEELMSKDIFPFKNLINNGLRAIMVGHISLPKIDSSNLPASQSPIVIKEILRNELQFNGVIITDDTEMKGYSSNDEEYERSLIKSFNAGIDMFLVCHTKEKQQLALSTIKSAIKKGDISHKRLNESVLRIIKLKEKI